MAQILALHGRDDAVDKTEVLRSAANVRVSQRAAEPSRSHLQNSQNCRLQESVVNEVTDHAEAFALAFRGVTLAQNVEDFPREVPDTVGQRDWRIKKPSQEGTGCLPQGDQIWCSEGIFSNPSCAANAIRRLTLYKDSIRAGVGESVCEIDGVWPLRRKTCSRFFRRCLLTVNLRERNASLVPTEQNQAHGGSHASIGSVVKSMS